MLKARITKYYSNNEGINDQFNVLAEYEDEGGWRPLDCLSTPSRVVKTMPVKAEQMENRIKQLNPGFDFSEC